jgi:hypothetical protein
MSTTGGVLRQAGGRYRSLGRAVARPFRAAEHEVEHLHDVERAGESGETPFIAVAGLIVFLGSIFLVIFGLASLAYWLAS